MAAPHSISPDLIEAKRALRQRMLAAREAWDPAAAGLALMRVVLQQAPPPSDAVLSGFWPIGKEIDIRPLLHALHERGHTIVLPVTPKRGNPLSFRRWRPGDLLEPERFGTFRPVGEAAVPDFLLVPLLAFDRRGHRVGYGAGFYDRTLAALPARRYALGVAYAAQELPEVPAGPADIRLDAVATDRALIPCQEF
ncbi:MAG TPA: 5-formyltetrahydrofolate cyclo-ligase [Acetobacteraceae bacterium]|nr:5-formyltetrahydrofolate cyclo-ligase [Acetobacteraceae bacterium]